MSLTEKQVGTIEKQAFYDYKYKRYRNDPMAWLVERFKEPGTTIKWSDWDEKLYGKHVWDGTPDPFLAACNGLVSHKGVGIESATGTGKTYFLSRVVYWFLDCFPDSLVVTTAPKEKQLKSILWSEISKSFNSFKRIRPNAELYSLRLLPDGKRVHMRDMKDEELKDMHQAIGVTAGVKADEESATKMQGFHRKYMLFIIEEAAGVALPIITAIKNTCTGVDNKMLAVGNPDSVVDSLHQFCELPYILSIRISGYDHPNVVLGKDVIPGAVTQESLDIRKLEYGDESNFFKSRGRGLAPLQSTDSLIKYDWVKQCSPIMDAEAKNIPVDTASANALGIDVANSTAGDKAATAWGKDNKLNYLVEFQCPNANDLANNVVEEDDKLRADKKQVYNLPKIRDWEIPHECIGVDAVGVGVGTVNEFKNLDIDVKGLQGGQDDTQIPLDAEEKPLYEFSSLRAQMYWQLRQDLMKKQVVININDKMLVDKLIKQLIDIKYKTSNRSIVVESKEDVKKRIGGESPNLADAVVYWNWVRKDRGTENFDVDFY